MLLVDNLGYFDNLGCFWVIIWGLLVAYLGCANGRKSHRLSFTQPGGRFGRRQAHVGDPDGEVGPFYDLDEQKSRQAYVDGGNE